MKIGLRSHNGVEDRLSFAQQIGAQGASIWALACDSYAGRGYLTAEDVRSIRERFDRYDLELTGIGLGGDCIKKQLLGLPGRDREIDNVCRTIRSIGEAYQNGAPPPVIIIDLVPSPYNGLLPCLGCMQEAGEIVLEVIRYFGERKKIFYVHFRNVIGTVPKYTEVFPDEGDGDMVANLKALKAVGDQGYLVPDHHFGVAADDVEYPLISRAWQVGYIRGMLQALGD